MTPAELKTLHESDATAVQLLAAGSSSGDYEPWAARMRAIAPRVLTPSRWTYRGLASSAGVGSAITRRLIVTVRTLAAVDPLIDELQLALRTSDSNGGIDIADEETVAQLTAAAGLAIADGITLDDVAAITFLAWQPAPITVADRGKVRA